jgi:hypothetical protein
MGKKKDRRKEMKQGNGKRRTGRISKGATRQHAIIKKQEG